MLRAAVVGMGVMGRIHATEYVEMEDVELAGVVETDESKHEALEREYRVPVVDRPESLLSGVDLVSVCTPDDRHLESVAPWLEAGVRVLVEKPLAMKVADGEQILNMCRDQDALMVGHILRFDPRVIRGRESVQAGELGDLWHIEVWRSTSRSVAATPAQRTTVAWFLGVHDADLVRYVTGLDVEGVNAIGAPCLSNNADVVYAMIQYSNGAIGSMRNSWTVPDNRPERHPAGLRVTGSKGSLEIDLGQVDLMYSTNDNAVQLDTRHWPSRSHSGVANITSEIRAFVDATKRGGPSPISGEEGLAAVRVVELIHQSIEHGGEVRS